MASAAPGPRFQVNGAAAGYLIDGFDIQEEQLKTGGSPASLGLGWGVEPESAWGKLFDGERELLMPSERGRWDTFYPAVATGRRRSRRTAGRSTGRGGNGTGAGRRPGVLRDRHRDPARMTG